MKILIEQTTGKLAGYNCYESDIRPGTDLREIGEQPLPGPIQDCYFDGTKILYLKTDAEKLAAGKLTQAQIDDKEIERMIAEKTAKLEQERKRQAAIDVLKAEGKLTAAGKIQVKVK